MKLDKVIYILLVLFPCHSISAQEKEEEAGDSPAQLSSYENKFLNVDLKVWDVRKVYFGLDYNLDFDRKITELGKDSRTDLFVELQSRGFFTIRGADKTNNSIVSQVKIKGEPLWRVKSKEIQSNTTWRDDINNPNYNTKYDSLIDEVRKETSLAASPLWLFSSFHGKHETSQDFKNFNYAFGGEVSITTSYLNSLLDFPFKWIRWDEHNNPRQLDLSLGYDYVMGLENTDLYDLRDGSSIMHRIKFSGEWETGIFSDKYRILFLFDSYYDLTATELQKQANKDLNYFFMVKLERLINARWSKRLPAKIALKYTTGALPPNFDKGYILGGGLSVDF